VVGSCEYGHEPSGLIEDGEFNDGLKNFHLPENNSASCTYFNVKIRYRKVGNKLG
jgi:hypothetical protein